jgi:hypothetical protein
MSITVQPGDNAFWGLQFLEGSGEAAEIRGARPEEVETALRIARLSQGAQVVSPSYSAVAAEESPDRAV